MWIFWSSLAIMFNCLQLLQEGSRIFNRACLIFFKEVVNALQNILGAPFKDLALYSLYSHTFQQYR